MADALFEQADLNKDERLDINEFRNLIVQNLGRRSGTWSTTAADGAQYTASSHESGGASSYDILANSAGAGAAGNESFNEQSSYAEASGNDTSLASAFGTTGLERNASYTVGASSSLVEASSSQQQQQLQVDPSNPRNLFLDPNPQIIRRQAQHGPLTYTQNVRIRFLQPPPVPPPGPLIIKEVRPPQPPPPPPLRIRQQAPPPSQPKPLVLRERPPNPPPAVASQTVIRRLPALPLPPRSVVIERLPPLPPKPRDIIIERWIPYGAQAKRKTIVQRAAAAKGYAKPRNIIIIYEPIQVRVIRQFQRLGVTRENPELYIQRYGQSLLDPQTLVQQARAAGVIEDIAPPTNFTASAGFSNATYGFESTTSNTNALASSFDASDYSNNEQGRSGLSGSESAQGVSFSNEGFSSSYEGGVGTALNGTSTSGYESYNAAAAGVFNNNSGDAVSAAFSAADLNKDGRLDVDEFRRFLSSQLRQ